MAGIKNNNKEVVSRPGRGEGWGAGGGIAPPQGDCQAAKQVLGGGSRV